MGYLAIAKLALQLLNTVAGAVADERERGLGRREAIANGLTKAHVAVTAARQAETEAQAAQAADPTDGAFDPSFKRSE